MAENMKRFLEKVSADNTMREKVNMLNKEERIALAKELGIELAEADFAQPATELSDDELGQVSAAGTACVPTMNPEVMLGRHDIPADEQKGRP